MSQLFCRRDTWDNAGFVNDLDTRVSCLNSLCSRADSVRTYRQLGRQYATEWSLRVRSADQVTAAPQTSGRAPTKPTLRNLRILQCLWWNWEKLRRGEQKKWGQGCELNLLLRFMNCRRAPRAECRAVTHLRVGDTNTECRCFAIINIELGKNCSPHCGCGYLLLLLACSATLIKTLLYIYLKQDRNRKVQGIFPKSFCN
ncbi:unnamed protein product [Spodoptera littoralis]|uniref:Uncharacterized protein n=1 Tax=Spodoptera littoralis TaxID=7109 RepID=A0A9P0HWV6_SPOLI|nr:unnamed protein product [Spodoptera littoralis]CAH1635876.1 unnamed protein product [Spodoptera littoralis]